MISGGGGGRRGEVGASVSPDGRRPQFAPSPRVVPHRSGSGLEQHASRADAAPDQPGVPAGRGIRGLVSGRGRLLEPMGGEDRMHGIGTANGGRQEGLGQGLHLSWGGFLVGSACIGTAQSQQR